jgi:cell division protein FtsW (lipid II flippase)
MDIINGIIEGIGNFFSVIPESVGNVFEATSDAGHIYTAFARWIFIFLALFILLKMIMSLLKSRNPSEVWAYLHVGEYENLPLTHWENNIGRAKSCDIQINDLSVSRNHGILTRDDDGDWRYMDLGAKNGAYINGRKVPSGHEMGVKIGDTIQLGAVRCTLFPISLQERQNNIRYRQEDTVLPSPWPSLLALTIFQMLTLGELYYALGEDFNAQIPISFIGMAVLMWVYVILLWGMHRRAFEMEIIAFFLSTLSLAVMAASIPGEVLKQFISVVIGVGLFFFMCTFLRDLERTRAIKKYVYIAAVLLLLINMIFGTTINGSTNWVRIAGMTFQPSELVKLAFIWVGAATMDELFDRKSSLRFSAFAVFCFLCLAKIGDLGAAAIFFATYLVISFLRSGDFARLLSIGGVAFVAALLVLKFRSYAVDRLNTWGHIWEPDFINNSGFQQTRSLTDAASGGLIGLGAGRGNLRFINASETDMVFCFLAEEWGLIVAVMAVLAIVTLSIFAYRSIMSGRSTYYTIAACSAMTLFLLQTILNVFGSTDILPFTGVAFPFTSAGGTSMIASWGLLAFLKAADTRQNASIAVSLKDKAVVGGGEGL